jgi:hypothetical protein
LTIEHPFKKQMALMECVAGMPEEFTLRYIPACCRANPTMPRIQKNNLTHVKCAFKLMVLFLI